MHKSYTDKDWFGWENFFIKQNGDIIVLARCLLTDLDSKNYYAVWKERMVNLSLNNSNCKVAVYSLNLKQFVAGYIPDKFYC